MSTRNEYELKNAVITGAEIGIDDRGLLSSQIRLDYGETSQSFGGYTLYLPVSFSHHRIHSLAGHWIFRIMEIAGVREWSDLPGKSIRVKATFDRVIEIGHIVKDDWFNLEKSLIPA
jgi:hypothetical protein